MSILVVTTGGTIGALPYESPVHPPEFSTMPDAGCDLVRDALADHFAPYAARCVTLEPRDSKLIDDPYRAHLLRLIEDAAEPLALVTHGTDTILQSAEYLHAQSVTRPGRAERRIILTGSMIPLSNGVESDGHANLAFALASLVTPPADMVRVNVVLSDFDADGTWRPRLHPIGGVAWSKVYDADGRYNRIAPAPAR